MRSCSHNSRNVEGSSAAALPPRIIIIEPARAAQLTSSNVKLRDDPINWWLVLYFIVGTVIYYAASGPIAYFFSVTTSEYLPSYNTGKASNILIKSRVRGVHIDLLPVNIFAFFMIMYIVGFTFVEVVNLVNCRGNPFIGRDGTYKDIMWAAIIAGIMFAFSGIVTLRQSNDLSNYCNATIPDMRTLSLINHHHEHGYPMVFNMTAAELTDSPLQQLFASIDQMDYLTKHPRDFSTTPECHLYSPREVFNYNYLIWTVAFFVGLQFTHFDNGIFSDLTLDWNVMKNWPWYMWVIFLGLVTLLTSIISYIFYLYYLIGYLSAYLTLLSGAIGVLSFFATWYSYWGYHLHIHHWFLGAFVQAFLCYQNSFITVVQAIFGGISTEGGSRWGYDSIFETGDNMCERSANALTRLAQSRARKLNYAMKSECKVAPLSENAPLLQPYAGQANLVQAPIVYQIVDHPIDVSINVTIKQSSEVV